MKFEGKVKKPHSISFELSRGEMASGARMIRARTHFGQGYGVGRAAQFIVQLHSLFSMFRLPAGKAEEASTLLRGWPVLHRSTF